MTTINIDKITSADFPNSAHEKILKQGENCGCLSCLSVFPVAEITDWMKEHNSDQRTAWCPKCHVDNVIPEIEGIMLNKEILQSIIELRTAQGNLLVRLYRSKK